jgi:hypothetical protein
MKAGGGRTLAFALQRSAGNRAVAGMVKVARARVTSGRDFRASVPVRTGATPGDLALAPIEKRIKTRLVRYNRIATDPTQLAARIQLLGELDHEIYSWFNALQSTDFDIDTPGLPEPRAVFMRRLMEELDREHVNVVHRSMAAGIVPIYGAGLSAPEMTRATALWNSVSQGAGMLQIESGGDVGFERKTLSSLAKMLHTQTGRDAIEFLDAPPPGPGAPAGVNGALLPVHPSWGTRLTGYETFIIPETQALRQAGIAGATGTGEDSANKPLSQVHGAGPGQSGYTRLPAAPAPAALGGYPVVTNAREYNRALLEGKPGFAIDPVGPGGVREYYEFGTGEGNALVMKYGQFARGIGAGNVEVISPDFVLLAHEMGHAVRVRGGGYAADEQFGWFGEAPPNWQNKAEEMSNVIGIENPVRQESGITPRTTYNTWKFVHGQAQLGNLVVAFGPILQDLQTAGFSEAEVWTWAKTQPAAKTLFMYGMLGIGPLTAAEVDERKDLKDRVSTPLLNQAQGAVPTFYTDFMQSKVPTLLPPLLRQVSDDDGTKAAALEAGLDATEKVRALAYLRVNGVNGVKALMHFGYSARKGTTEAKRAAARLAALKTLLGPGGSLASAQTQRNAVATAP